jgi:hypothetical protein
METLPLKIIVFLFAVLPLVCGAQDTPESSLFVKDMVERINKRYDDFYLYHREMEERASRFEQGRGDRKVTEKAYYAKLEQARVAYVQAKKPRGSMEHLRAGWEQQEKDRRDKQELNRQRHVRSRDEVEKYLLKGRKIPELKEYGLEGY